MCPPPLTDIADNPAHLSETEEKRKNGSAGSSRAAHIIRTDYLSLISHFAILVTHREASISAKR